MYQFLHNYPIFFSLFLWVHSFIHTNSCLYEKILFFNANIELNLHSAISLKIINKIHDCHSQYDAQPTRRTWFLSQFFRWLTVFPYLKCHHIHDTKSERISLKWYRNAVVFFEISNWMSFKLILVDPANGFAQFSCTAFLLLMAMNKLDEQTTSFGSFMSVSAAIPGSTELSIHRQPTHICTQIESKALFLFP